MAAGGEVLGWARALVSETITGRAPRRNENRFGMNAAAAIMAGGEWKSFTPLSLSPGSKESSLFPLM